jgi:hypothetical protein
MEDRRIIEDNIKIYLREMGVENVNLIDAARTAQSRVWYYRCLIYGFCDQRSGYFTHPPAPILVIS